MYPVEKKHGKNVEAENCGVRGASARKVGAEEGGHKEQDPNGAQKQDGFTLGKGHVGRHG